MFAVRFGRRAAPSAVRLVALMSVGADRRQYEAGASLRAPAFEEPDRTSASGAADQATIGIVRDRFRRTAAPAPALDDAQQFGPNAR